MTKDVDFVTPQKRALATSQIITYGYHFVCFQNASLLRTILICSKNSQPIYEYDFQGKIEKNGAN